MYSSPYISVSPSASCQGTDGTAAASTITAAGLTVGTVTAAASAGVYFVRGDIDPFVAAPVALGVMLGALAGSRVLGRIPASTLRMVFVAVVLVVASQMLWKGIHL